MTPTRMPVKPRNTSAPQRSPTRAPRMPATSDMIPSTNAYAAKTSVKAKTALSGHMSAATPSRRARIPLSRNQPQLCAGRLVRAVSDASACVAMAASFVDSPAGSWGNDAPQPLFLRLKRRFEPRHGRGYIVSHVYDRASEIRQDRESRRPEAPRGLRGAGRRGRIYRAQGLDAGGVSADAHTADQPACPFRDRRHASRGQLDHPRAFPSAQGNSARQGAGRGRAWTLPLLRGGDARHDPR